ncbi:MAG TPA: hypothetical protein VIM09_08175, partial [Chthoniobacterales bacterium]
GLAVDLSRLKQSRIPNSSLVWKLQSGTSLRRTYKNHNEIRPNTPKNCQCAIPGHEASDRVDRAVFAQRASHPFINFFAR